jgi:peptidoglycan/xylan/chitin deacetylase (PgdA/CDA1 family)
MSLPDDYLTYPHRSYGMDQGRYDWRPVGARSKIAWPGGQPLAAMIVVPIEHHTLEPSGKPFKPPGAMQTPYPDLRHYTTRDYGNRVGVYRILKALKSAGVRATFPVNAGQLGRLKPLVEAILTDGHEIAACGLAADHIHWSGLEAGVEAARIDEVRRRFDAAGLRPRVWLSPARQQSFSTLDLIAAKGFDICLDWEIDEVPVALRTDCGPVTALPLSNELDDRSLMIDRRQTEDEWADQVLDAARYLGAGTDRFGARMLGFTLTPYVSGQPFRTAALRRMLAGLTAGGVWAATASQIADAAAQS